jgi:glutamyl-tRNA synthetase
MATGSSHSSPAVDGSSRAVRVRVAPSPTGDPHVGTAYMALFNYVFAKQSGGRFILRIEDTDRARARAGSERAIFAALRWTGLSWDEGPDVGGDFGPYRQSERSAIYGDHAAQLLEKGEAYRCFCTPERLAELRAVQQKEKQNPGYDRLCRGLDPAEASRRAVSGEPHTVRLAVPLGVDCPFIAFEDKLRGRVEIPSSQIDDQVLLKSDGYPTYHLANVVDDHLMEISHVIRAEEWISSTPKHVLLYRAFGWEQPEWIHMPLLRNQDKSKISKRKNPVSIEYYRDAGVLPEALLNFLGIMGWSFGDDREKFTLEEMVEVFSWDRVSLGGPVFNFDKLVWLNEQYIHQLSDIDLARRLLEWRLGESFLTGLAPMLRERIKLLSDFVPATEYFFANELDYGSVADQLAIKDVPPADLRKGILALLERYDALAEFDAEALEASTRAFAEERGWKAGKLFMVLRLAVTGRKASPPLFDTMVGVGKELTRHRLRQVAELLKSRK